MFPIIFFKIYITDIQTLSVSLTKFYNFASNKKNTENCHGRSIAEFYGPASTDLRFEISKLLQNVQNHQYISIFSRNWGRIIEDEKNVSNIFFKIYMTDTQTL